MKRGEIIRTKSVNVIFGGEKVRGTATFKAIKGKHMVFLLLGHANENEMFDPEKALQEMGFFRKDSAADEGKTAPADAVPEKDIQEFHEGMAWLRKENRKKSCPDEDQS